MLQRVIDPIHVKHPLRKVNTTLVATPRHDTVAARTVYNNAVKDYNAYISQFPAVLTAKATGAKARTYCQATTDAANTVPTVDFSKPAPATDGKKQ